MADLFFMPFRPAYDGNMKVLVGAQLWFTASETNVPANIYADEEMTVPLANPVVANSVGRFPTVWMDETITYRLRVYDKDAQVGVDTPLEEYDPYAFGGQLGEPLLSVSDVPGLTAVLESLAPLDHDHDDRYYTKAEIDGMLSAKQDNNTLLTSLAALVVAANAGKIVIVNSAGSGFALAASPGDIVLSPLSWISGGSVPENAPNGTVVGVVGTRTSGSTLSLSDSAGGKFAINSTTGEVTKAGTLNYGTASSHNIAVDEAKAGATNTPKTSPLTVAVTQAGTTGAVAQEGDSITAWPGGYAKQYDAAYPSLDITNYAVGGNGISNLEGRASTVLATDPAVLTVAIGANDLPYTGGASAYYNRLKAYVAPFRSGGSKVVICTVLPMGSTYSSSGYASFNAARDALNTLLRAGVGVDFDALADFDLTLMGNAANANNTTYFLDGLHPTIAGHDILYPVYKAALNNALGQTNEVTPFAFTDVVNATASASYQSGPITITGLHGSETKPYSVTGGQVSKNGGAFSGTSGTVQRGDTLEVKGTASATGGASVNVALTVGSLTDTFTIQTASAAPLTTTYRSSGAMNGAYGGSATFAGVSFYAGKNIVGIMSSSAGFPSAVSLDGTAGTMVASISTSGKTCSFWEIPKATGGTGNLVITRSGIWAVGYALWTTNADAVFDSSQSKAYAYSNDPQTTPAITVPSGGSALVLAHSEAVGSPITPGSGVTEDAEFVDTGNWRFWAGEMSAAGTPTVTGLAFAGSQMLAAVWKPA